MNIQRCKKILARGPICIKKCDYKVQLLFHKCSVHNRMIFEGLHGGMDNRRKGLSGADLAFFQGGVLPIVHEPRSGEPIFFFFFFLRAAKRRAFFFFFFFFAILRAAKRRAYFFFFFFLRAAKRRADFCFLLFYEPRSGEPIFWLFYEPQSGEPIFLGLFWTPVSDVFLASTNAMETMITSLTAQGGGGGGFKPYCLRLSLRQSAIGTYCVDLDILWWRFSMHIKFLLGSPRGGGFKPPKPPPPRFATGLWFTMWYREEIEGKLRGEKEKEKEGRKSFLILDEVLKRTVNQMRCEGLNWAKSWEGLGL